MSHRRTRAVFLGLALLAACTAQDADPEGAAGAAWEVDFRRFGPVPLGVSFDEANAAAGGTIERPDSLAGCSATRVVGGGERTFLMVVDGRVVRVDVRDPDVTTARGARIGDSEDRIRRLYPGLEVRPHKYTEGHYLVVTPDDDSQYRLIFETGEGLVRTYRAGVLPEVEWVEGCG